MKHYLFDFDGTLVDSMPTYVSAMLRILDETGTPYGEDIVRIITPLGLLGAAEYYVSIGVPLEKEEILRRMGQYMYEAYVSAIPAKEEVADTLRELKKRGVHLHVLTASPHVTLDPCLARLGLTELFENVWSCDDFGTTKSDPDIYRQAAARMGVDVSAVWFFDDNLLANETAKRSGMRTCGVYDDSSAGDEAKIRAATDHYVRAFSEILFLQ